MPGAQASRRRPRGKQGMKLKRFCALVLVAFALCFAAACGDENVEPEDPTPTKPIETPQTFVHEEGGIEFTAPKGWKTPNDGGGNDEAITLNSPDEQLEITFFAPDDGDVEASAKDLVEDLGKYIKNGKVTQTKQESSINGLKTATIAGTGEDADDNDKVDWTLTIIEAKKPVFVVSVATQGTYAKNDAAYQSLVQSIRPVAESATPTPNKQ
jgi:predicted Zn-dependent protease